MAVVTDRVQPNGLAFSPDEGILYVSDTGSSHVPGHPRTITAYEVWPDNTARQSAHLRHIGGRRL